MASDVAALPKPLTAEDLAEMYECVADNREAAVTHATWHWTAVASLLATIRDRDAKLAEMQALWTQDVCAKIRETEAKLADAVRTLERVYDCSHARECIGCRSIATECLARLRAL